MSDDIGRELGWDDTIENDGPEFVILPDGDYDFEIVKFERGRHPGSANLPACNKATVHVRVQGPEGINIIAHNLFLHSKTEGFLCSFFVGLGQRKHGERVTMNWNQVVGSKGRCKIYIDKWTNDEGKEILSNKIKKFYEPDDVQPAMFKPGTF